MLLPYVPAGHGRHAASAPGLYVPSAHGNKLAAVDDGGHANPAGHDPEHATEFEVPSPRPYTPPGHGVHVDAPASLYCPAGHATDLELVDLGPHVYPAEHLPSHRALVAGTSPVAKVPAGQSRHASPTPPRL